MKKISLANLYDIGLPRASFLVLRPLLMAVSEKRSRFGFVFRSCSNFAKWFFWARPLAKIPSRHRIYPCVGFQHRCFARRGVLKKRVCLEFTNSFILNISNLGLFTWNTFLLFSTVYLSRNFDRHYYAFYFVNIVNETKSQN